MAHWKKDNLLTENLMEKVSNILNQGIGTKDSLRMENWMDMECTIIKQEPDIKDSLGMMFFRGKVLGPLKTKITK